MPRSYGYRPSMGVDRSLDVKDELPRLSNLTEVNEATTAAALEADKTPKPTKKVARRVRRPQPVAPKDEQDAASRSDLDIAVDQALAHVRGGELPRTVAEQMQDERFRGVLIYLVGQKLGEVGLQGAAQDEAHERLAMLPLDAQELLLQPDQTQDLR